MGILSHVFIVIRSRILCREAETRIELFEPLVDSLLTHWNYKTFDEKLLDITLLKQAQNSYNMVYGF